MKSWIAPLARAVPAIALGIAITFSADHSATLGLIVFGIFGVVTGIAIGAFALRDETGSTRSLSLVQAALGVLLGAAALIVPGGGLPYLVFLVSAWAVTTGFLEIYLGIRSRGSAVSRDRLFLGALTVVLAIVVLVVPPDFVQEYTVDDNGYQLTASVIIVGLLGAYGAIVGVFLVIAGLSLKFATTPEPVETSA
ncbi:uncharacterized membrane protein HdeD (DUF308 family) [Microbacteriaceae bacterium SG_E_30_P1]|uniref:Uncharacterized membrane protein HdeD (DUF308 family) n=1 Tax=Antiquaquibacter oligotrophicus TaxID=2880260 RepID=A0ABT6KQY4_9MICO|nr:DUF308 domain-containing protein [Antiquaquibacter oligotrophicus]MDH6182390.1 uncharacterized membrane protein HdeD (DUF308 family) [Antiquaquibacter oligotrophicus]UDF14636.1 DUF308 domain-containing protein [Antiquaquibacter oligotrophicus]